jgi:hypothetical protein
MRRAATQPLETGDMMVVTVQVPATSARELSVEVAGHEVTILGPAGFRHGLELSTAADAGRLHAALYLGSLELRAPRGVTTGSVARRTVQAKTFPKEHGRAGLAGFPHRSPRTRGQPRADVDRSSEGDRARNPGVGRKTERLRRTGADSDRIDRRPDHRGVTTDFCPGDQQRLRGASRCRRARGTPPSPESSTGPR